MSRFYKLLLRVYPRWFRERYAEELVEAFVADRRRAPAGIAGTVRFWLTIVGDLIFSACRTRARARAARVGRADRSSFMDVLLQDLRLAARQLLARPGFAAVAVLSLAVGIGGNALIMAFFDGYVFHPFRYPEPDRVVAIGSTFPRVSSEEGFVEAISAPEFLDFRALRAFDSIAAFDLGNRNISGGDRPERVLTALALTDLFAPFGLPPALGRGFTAEELAPRGPAVAIVSYRLWHGRFGGDSTIVGRTVRVNGVATTIVGVMPPELLVLGSDLWIPWGGDVARMPRNTRPFTVIGRLAPGVSLDAANAEAATVASQTAAAHAAQFPEYEGWRVSVTPWTIALMRDIRPAAWLLLGAVGLVLLIVCANLSNLLLARASARRRDLAVRQALGAGSGRIASHLLAEIVLIALAGATAGLAFAYAALPLLVSLVPPELNTISVTATINGRVIAWSALLTVTSSVLVALLPLLQSRRALPRDALASEGRGSTAARSQIDARQALIVAEIALSVVLLVGAGLMARSLARLQAIEPGFDPADVLTMRITLPQEKYRDGAVADFFQTLVDAVEQAPGVRSASVATQFPPRGPFAMPVRVLDADEARAGIPTALVTVASEEHFSTLRVRMMAGRAFASTDRRGAPLVAVVNEAFAAQFLPGVAPVGRRLTTGPAERSSPPVEIVGVVANTRNRGARGPAAPEIFMPLRQQNGADNQLFLLVRAETDTAATLATVRERLAGLDADQPLYAIQTLEAALATDAFRQRFSLLLFGVFAAIALTLAALGIYGVMSYAVGARTQEIGVRLAMGAERRTVLWLILRQVARMTAIGLALGIGGALALSGVLRRVLFEVQPADPVTLAAVVIVLGSVALVAGWLPAWRASRVDPIDALREF